MKAVMGCGYTGGEKGLGQSDFQASPIDNPARQTPAGEFNPQNWAPLFTFSYKEHRFQGMVHDEEKRHSLLTTMF
jgi:hypothetical protein